MIQLLNDWWCSLRTENKEHIASKVARRAVKYPEATAVWNGLTEEKKQSIHDHCTDAHGMVQDEWKEGDGYSY